MINHKDSYYMSNKMRYILVCRFFLGGEYKKNILNALSTGNSDVFQDRANFLFILRTLPVNVWCLKKL